MRVLIVDDEPGLVELLVEYLHGEGHQTRSAATASEGLALASSFRPAVIFLDQHLPDQIGSLAMRQMRLAAPGCQVVIMTGQPELQGAVDAVHLGAQDYLPKPLDLVRLRLILKRQQENLDLRAQVEGLRRFQLEGFQKEQLLLADPKMDRIYRQAEQVAGLEKISVLIQGESGSGKQHVARLIHFLSPRASGPFVEIHCGTVAEQLLERELFGYEAGAFAGALQGKAGLLETASGGTLFFDEIGELPVALQSRLLGVLEEQRFQRLGGSERRPLNLRLLASTHRDLEQEAAAGSFRKDLYYRMNAFSIHLPPLRERTQDIASLAQHFLDGACREFGQAPVSVPSQALARLEAYAWPGNVRELKNLMERLVITREEQGPDWDALEELLDYAPLPEATVNLVAGTTGPGTLDAVERRLILETLRRFKGNRTKTADHLGINRKTLFNKLKIWEEEAKSGKKMPR